ncbi:hypothetical protein K439DRAFT_390128 [Ramaria rubella]|nr:hypothetical protein K439DRAFT_390128 [Ramaria rubella]
MLDHVQTCRLNLMSHQDIAQSLQSDSKLYARCILTSKWTTVISFSIYILVICWGVESTDHLSIAIPRLIVALAG